MQREPFSHQPKAQEDGDAGTGVKDNCCADQTPSKNSKWKTDGQNRYGKEGDGKNLFWFSGCDEGIE